MSTPFQNQSAFTREAIESRISEQITIMDGTQMSPWTEHQAQRVAWRLLSVITEHIDAFRESCPEVTAFKDSLAEISIITQIILKHARQTKLAKEHELLDEIHVAAFVLPPKMAQTRTRLQIFDRLRERCYIFQEEGSDPTEITYIHESAGQIIETFTSASGICANAYHSLELYGYQIAPVYNTVWACDVAENIPLSPRWNSRTSKSTQTEEDTIGKRKRSQETEVKMEH